jgi:hypothetical protein
VPSPNNVECEEHGLQPETFVCQHVAMSLRSRVRVGFFWADQSNTDRPNAWCRECNERVSKTNGEWLGEARAHLQAKLLCGACYDDVRTINLSPGAGATS